MSIYNIVTRHCVVALLCATAFCACSKDEVWVKDDAVTEGSLPSAGTATVYNIGVSAYDTPAPWVTGDLLRRFYAGDRLYDSNRGTEGGKGPLYAGSSCGSCHSNAGRTLPSMYGPDSGSGTMGFSSQLVYITKQNGSFFRNYGRVLHDQVIKGEKAEGKLQVTFTEKTFSFPDGEKYSLQTPHYKITDWYAEEIDPKDLIIDVHIPLRHVGMGQIMALDHDELRRLAAQSNYPEYGISGRLSIITERNKQYVGTGGNKAHHADLTVELGFSSDLGVTNDRYPLEVSHGQSQNIGYSHYGIQISTREMEDVDLYLSTLGVPARRNVNDPAVKRGEENFYRAKCQLCHTPTLHTRQDAVTLLNGTRLPWLSNQTIHPYSDFLLHDMGPGLDNHVRVGSAYSYEWRTTPLWGIGLQQTVNSHTRFLHDGRARNLLEAIMWHDGEGAVSREIFSRMSKQERDDLITFLNSL
ncbi:di-heme oxidoredictase family protein [Proteiniphilum sp.]|uniref:di-heme oxidoredictase family protein n=1 Tax=Proteiniphilum sp. TaxID=1926877 RepID=UPI003A599C34